MARGHGRDRHVAAAAVAQQVHVMLVAGHPVVVQESRHLDGEWHPVRPRLLLHAVARRLEVVLLVMRRCTVVRVGVEVSVVWAMEGSMSIAF
jgi:hypothetical protein